MILRPIRGFVGPDGTLHQISLVFDADPVLCAFGRNDLALSKSEDGGFTWTDPILIIEDDEPNILNDKESITAEASAACAGHRRGHPHRQHGSGHDAGAAGAAAAGELGEQVKSLPS